MSNLVVAQLAATAAAAVFLTTEIERNRKRKRSCWIKHWRKRRVYNSAYMFVNHELLTEDKDSYRNYFRMDEDVYRNLLGHVEKYIMKCTTAMRESISPSEKLTATLRFLATGESYQSLHNQTRLSKSFLCKSIPEVCDAIHYALKDEYLKFPSSKEEWKCIAENFQNKWQFPLCLGSMDGKHINLRALRDDGAFYRTYKGTDSIVLLALVDGDYRFIYTYIGCNGRISDGEVLSRSDLMSIINDGDIHFPSDEIIGNNRKLPFVIVADDAFPLQRHIMKPYSCNGQDKQKRIFSYRLCRARRVVEHAFGILANRFRVLLKTIDLKVSTVQSVVQACCALHNFLLKEQNEKYLENTSECSDICDSGTEFNIQCQVRQRPGKEASEIREIFSEYFINEGKVNWQDSIV